MLTTARLSVAPSLHDEHIPCASVSKAVSGDPTDFENIYRIYSGRVYRLCLHMVKNPAEAEDLTQEVFLRIFQKMHQFEGRAAFSTWLHRVAVNLVLMRVRKKSLSTVSLEEILIPGNKDHRSQDFLATVDSRLAGTIDRAILARAMICLPFRCRLAFTLHDVEGYQHRDVASRMNCSAANSKSNVWRARLRLRELLRGARYSPQRLRKRKPTNLHEAQSE